MSYTATRLLFPTGQEFDEFVAKLEDAVPPFAPEDLDGAETWDEVTRRISLIATNGFVFFFAMTPSNAMQIAGNPTRSRAYLMGNPVTAERMYRHDPGVMVHAPLHVEVYELDDEAVFAIERPSAPFTSFGSDPIADVGVQLDGQLGDLLTHLGVPDSRLVHPEIGRPRSFLNARN